MLLITQSPISSITYTYTGEYLKFQPGVDLKVKTFTFSDK